MLNSPHQAAFYHAPAPLLRPRPRIAVEDLAGVYLPAVMEIEEQCFAENRWTDREFSRLIRAQDIFGLVALQAGAVVGYVVCRRHADRIEVLALAVHPGRQLQGVGKRLLGEVVGRLSPPEVDRVVLRVRERNLPCQKFLRAIGWRCVVVKRGFYGEGPSREDGYEFELRA